jgi:Sec-independent protein translocase protein TatA
VTVGVSGVVILLVLAILFFGLKRLPAVIRSARVGAKEFKDSSAGVSGLSSRVPAEPAPLPPPVPPAVPDVPEAD